MVSDHSVTQTCKQYFANTSHVHALTGLLQPPVCTPSKFLCEHPVHVCWKTQLLPWLSDSWHLGPLIKHICSSWNRLFFTPTTQNMWKLVQLSLRASRAETSAFQPDPEHSIFHTEAQPAQRWEEHCSSSNWNWFKHWSISHEPGEAAWLQHLWQPDHNTYLNKAVLCGCEKAQP